MGMLILTSAAIQAAIGGTFPVSLSSRQTPNRAEHIRAAKQAWVGSNEEPGEPEPKTAMSCELARSFHQHFPVFLLNGRADDPILEQLDAGAHDCQRLSGLATSHDVIGFCQRNP